MKRLADYFFQMAALCFLSVAGSHAQNQADSLQTVESKALKIFLDCDYCDVDYIRTEIAFVNYVRDRKEAQVHVLITTQATGSGGTEYTINLIGQLDYAGMADTLKYVSQKTNTSDEIRHGLVRVLKIGLLRYVAKTPQAEQINVTYNKPAAAKEVVDKWNYWVFSMNFNSFLNGQKSTDYKSLQGSLTANRVTPVWKINLRLSLSYNENNFDIGTSTISSISRSKNFRALIVKSLGEHWSIGGTGAAFSSTYQNIDLAYEANPAIEYDLFPYSQSTRRQLRVLYKIGPSRYDYDKETIYGKTSETLFNHSLSITLYLQQPWGSVETSLEGSNYFHDFNKNRVDFFSSLSLRLFKGLSIRLFGNYSRIHDQLSLPAAGATPEEILLQRRQLETQYSYFASLGLSYTFGSIYNNIVNPRFGSDGGGSFFISF
jgi:hypothetical protein